VVRSLIVEGLVGDLCLAKSLVEGMGLAILAVVGGCIVLKMMMVIIILLRTRLVFCSMESLVGN